MSRQDTGVAHPSITRRQVIQGCAAASTVGLAGMAGADPSDQDQAAAAKARKGRINQSIVYWCFEKHWDLEKTCQVARQLGCGSVELVPPEQWPILKKHGLVCALTASHGYVKGMNNPDYHPMCREKIRSSVDACAEYGFPNVITFTGFREDIPDDVGLANCVKGLKEVVGYAEKKKVNLVLEILNSRVDVEMKGHPGYQGDHTDYCMEIIRQVGSPRLKLLFDVYHVQVMDGDIISRIRQYREHIGHYHTAGNPGRCELDEDQEINYKPIMEEIARSGYTGYVADSLLDGL